MRTSGLQTELLLQPIVTGASRDIGVSPGSTLTGIHAAAGEPGRPAHPLRARAGRDLRERQRYPHAAKKHFAMYAGPSEICWYVEIESND